MSSEVCEKGSPAANIPIEVGGSLTWQKLSPAEFQQLQDFMACKYFFLTNSKRPYAVLLVSPWIIYAVS